MPAQQCVAHGPVLNGVIQDYPITEDNQLKLTERLHVFNIMSEGDS